MKTRPLLFCYLLLVIAAFPLPAHAYLVPLLGLIGGLGGVVGIAITAVLSLALMIFLPFKQVRALFTGKKKQEEEAGKDDSPSGGQQ